ncbi:tRNA 3'-trailer sequence RNase, putative [Plasmodium relictum]|uniref:ribonuclease Z n=1 Tax=Plasmodium relictum TaxID=85471 RepID=A0A1J1H9S8_PLARL|nr:tRNA 3'-trailer sequence RNase, putative [Plasmodium relictum]CRH01271.1 tRNA 3'-trailer sequence RNase, putative [Plasmodium relictum]
MEVYIQIIGWHRLAIPSSLRLFVNGDVTLFNCGENNQRFLNEHKLHLVKIKNIFFTKINPETIGGLIGLLLTIDNISDNCISIYGPKPIERIINNFTSTFAKMKNIKIKVYEISNNISPIILKGNVVITPIILDENKILLKENMNIINDDISYINTNKKKIIKKDSMSYEKKNFYHKYGDKPKEEDPEDTYLNNLKKRKMDKNYGDRNGNESVTEYENKFEEKNQNNNLSEDENKKKNNNIAFNSICYLIECPQTLGKFHPEKAKSLNIPSGKYYGILKSGKSITINNKIIKTEDVCDKNIDGRKSLIIDLLNSEDINCLIKEITNKENFYLKNLEYVFHLSCDEITNCKKYRDFFLSLKNVKNIKCNQSNSSLSVCPFVSSSSLNNFLSKLLPNIFLKYKPDTPIYNMSYLLQNDKEKKDPIMIRNSFVNEKNETENVIQKNTNLNNINDLSAEAENEIINEKNEKNNSYLLYNPLTKFILHPFHKINICTSEMLSDLYPNIFNYSKISKVLKENEDLIKTFENFNQTKFSNFSEVPSFYFLGTGCSMPSTFRNVSGILLNIQKNFSIVLDFGEGSLYQLYWMSKSWIHFSEIIKSIKVIFISHSHADHHAGLYYLLYIRKIFFPNLDHPILLIPITLKSWMNLLNELFFDKPVKVIYNSENLEIKEKIEEDFLNMQLFKVNHINESYGVKIENKNIGSVVYSADTRPCSNIKKFSKGCNILIHEATFDDELLNEAIQKKHSTTQEAMQISLEVKCKILILTHFSQRYPKVPKLNKQSSTEFNEIISKTIYSFDYMCIPLNLINELPHYFNILLNLLEKIF